MAEAVEAKVAKLDNELAAARAAKEKAVAALEAAAEKVRKIRAELETAQSKVGQNNG